MLQPSCWERVVALLFYVGFLPIFGVYRPQRASTFIQVHRNQALILFAFLGVVFLLLISFVGLLSYGMVYYRDAVDSGRMEVWMLSFLRKLLIVWLVFGVYAVFRAFRGSSSPVPYMSVLTKNKHCQRLGTGVLFVLWILLLTIVPLIFIADCMVTGDVEEGSVFMVYEDQGRFPRALFSLVMLPITRESLKQYGAGSVVLLPISPEAIQTALQKGIIVILASHGTANGILLRDGYFTPADILPREDKTRLKFVYFAGCDGGAQRKAWEKALSPAEIYTYDRLTPVIEHLWWLWTQGPKVVREVAKLPV